METIFNQTSNLQRILTIFSNSTVHAELLRHLDVAKNPALEKDIFKPTSYYLKANKIMKVVQELQLGKYLERKIELEIAETNINKNKRAFDEFIALSRYNAGTPGKIAEESRLFNQQYTMMYELPVPGFEWTTFNDAFNVIIMHINKGDALSEHLKRDKISLQSMETQLNSYYERRRCLLVYTMLFMHQLRALVKANPARVTEYGNDHIGDPKDINDLKSNVGVMDFISALVLPNIQMTQTYDEVVQDTKKLYPSFQDHTIMNYVFKIGGWLENKMQRTEATATIYSSTVVFDEGKSGRFYLGDELGTFGTRGCAASGGAGLAGVASVSSRDDGVPVESGAAAMPVAEEPPRTVAKRVSKKIRFDADARYPSIAEEAAGGESAA
jgi:hypothetical protein